MMNKRMNLPALQKIMREFEVQNEKMEMTSETMGDAIDDAFEGDDEEEETDNLVNQVLDEIGISTDHEVKTILRYREGHHTSRVFLVAHLCPSQSSAGTTDSGRTGRI